MQAKNLHLYLALIIFIIFIELISGQISLGHLRGLRSFSESIITPSSNPYESEQSGDKIFTSSLDESSYPKEISTILESTHPTNPQTSHVDPTVKTSINSSEETFTQNTIPESSQDTTLSFSSVLYIEPTTSFNPETTIPMSQPSTVTENSSSNEITDNPFTTTPTDYTSIPTIETITTFPSSENTNDFSSIPTITSIPTTPTIPSVPTTPAIPSIPATPAIPSVPTTPAIPSIPTTPTIPSIPTTPTTPSSQLNLNYSSYLPTILSTSINPTNDLTIPKPPTTVPDTYNMTPSTITPIPPINPILVLLGFSHYNQYDSNISFYIYFSLLEGYIYSNNLKIPVEITYNTNLRLLQNNEANCNLKGIQNQKIAYLCEIQTENQGVSNVKIFPEFNFISQTANVTLSPLSNDYINNLQKIENQFNYFYNSSFYMLTKSKINKGEDKDRIFNITGIINEPLPKFQKINLVLKAIAEKGNENATTEINCNVIDINNNNYIIQCRVYDDKVYALQNAISFMDNEILLINFDKYSDSRVQFYVVDGLDAGSVIAIIIIIIFFGFFI